MDNSGFVGSRLKKAREARGMTAIQLADEIDVKRQAISNYERGKRSPAPHIKDRFCEVLGFPLSFFSVDSSEEDFQGTVFYRSMSAATKRARTRSEVEFEWLVDLVNLSELYVEFPKVNFPKFDVPVDPTKLSVSDIEELAEKTRRFWGLKDGPISNSVWLLENNGAVVVRRNLHADTLHAFSRWANERPYIVLSSNRDCASISRFDLAHELGHLILHRNLPEIYLRDSDYFKLIEKQANQFSAAFQFPQAAFAKEVVRTNLEFFRILKKRWRLSIGMMLKRAKDLYFIDEKRAANLWRSYSRNGWHQREPFDNEIPVEAPKLVRNSLEIIFKSRVSGRQNILDFLNLYHLDVESCAGLPEGFLNPNAAEVHTLRPRLREDVQPYNSDKAGKLIQFPAIDKLEN